MDKSRIVAGLALAAVAAACASGPTTRSRSDEPLRALMSADVMMLVSFDADGDLSVTTAEVDAGLTREFARADANSDRALQLCARLADSGEHDVGWRTSRAERDCDLTAGIRVECTADRPEQANDRERRIRFQCVMNAVRMRRERIIDGAVAVANGSGTVDVDGRIDALNDRFEAYAVAHKTRIGVRERLVHERRHVIMRALMAHRARVRVAPAMPAARA